MVNEQPQVESQEPELDIQAYQVKLATATPEEFFTILAEISKQKSAIAKAQAEAARKEAEALAGQREELAKAIYKAVKGVVDAKALEAVKAKGFTFKLDTPDANGVMVNYKSVDLMVPTIKAKKAGGGGGGTGVSTEAETGLKLDDLFNQYANDEERAEVAAIDTDTSLQDKAKNSKKWQVKTKAKKRILADNPNLVKK